MTTRPGEAFNLSALCCIYKINYIVFLVDPVKIFVLSRKR